MMKYVLQYFDLDSQEWKYLISSNDLNRIEGWYDCYILNYPKSHFRIIAVLKRC